VKEFWVVYDYSTGGVWGIARAYSEDEVTRAFPELTVVHKKPNWMDSDGEARTRSISSFAVDDPTTYPEWLRVLIAERASR